ncbi:MAG: hypothetical protein NT172_11645 [Planctomycetota bacterium]|nr:hypothetical protein [Planctomycetota bacterium]
MSFISSSDLKHLLNPFSGEACVSLYQATHCSFPDSMQDQIQFKNLLKVLEAKLIDHLKGREIRSILKAFSEFESDDEFWRNRTQGFAMFYHNGHIHRFDMPRAMPNLVIVSDSFHLKPIFRILQTADRFNILTLDRYHSEVFEATRDSITPLHLKDMPQFRKERDSGARTRVGEQHMSGSGHAVMVIHEVDDQLQDAQFFQEVDHFVERNLSSQTNLPLVLVALPEHQGTFRKISKNPHLLQQGVSTGPASLTISELRDHAYCVIKIHQHALIQAQLDDVESAKAQEKGSTDLSEISRAAVAGRVATLLIDADRTIPGKIDPATGEIHTTDFDQSKSDDILDDLMEIVFRASGKISILPSDLMPINTGVAAIYRY